MNKKQLLPCGCGGDAYHDSASCWNPEQEEWIPNFWHRVICKNCGTQTKAFYTEAEAITAWNRAMGATDMNVGDKFAKDMNVPRKGKWLWDEEEDRCYCSECGEEDDLSIDGVYMMHDFCPNCGADMRIHEIGRDRP